MSCLMCLMAGQHIMLDYLNDWINDFKINSTALFVNAHALNKSRQDLDIT
jgi:hypothetical protein